MLYSCQYTVLSFFSLSLGLPVIEVYPANILLFSLHLPYHISEFGIVEGGVGKTIRYSLGILLFTGRPNDREKKLSTVYWQEYNILTNMTQNQPV